MKTNQMMLPAAGIGMLFLVLSGGCGSSQSIPTYGGPAKPLQDVAVVRTSEETCPITRIDGVSVGEDYEAGNEYHLLPGKHAIQIVNTIGDCETYCRIELMDIEYDFQAGGVYAILQTEPVEAAAEARGLTGSPAIIKRGEVLGFVGNFGNESQKQNSPQSTLRVMDQGSVVAFAAEHPDYFKDSPAWKKLRKENGLYPSFSERIKLQLAAWGLMKPEPTVVAESKPVESF